MVIPCRTTPLPSAPMPLPMSIRRLHPIYQIHCLGRLSKCPLTSYRDSYIVKFDPAGRGFGEPIWVSLQYHHSRDACVISNYSILLGNTTIVGGDDGPASNGVRAAQMRTFLARNYARRVHAAGPGYRRCPCQSLRWQAHPADICGHSCGGRHHPVHSRCRRQHRHRHRRARVAIPPSNPATFTYYAETNRTSLPCSTGTRLPVTLTQLTSPTVVASSNSPVCQVCLPLPPPPTLPTVGRGRRASLPTFNFHRSPTLHRPSRQLCRHGDQCQRMHGDKLRHGGFLGHADTFGTGQRELSRGNTHPHPCRKRSACGANDLLVYSAHRRRGCEWHGVRHQGKQFPADERRHRHLLC